MLNIYQPQNDEGIKFSTSCGVWNIPIAFPAEEGDPLSPQVYPAYDTEVWSHLLVAVTPRSTLT